LEAFERAGGYERGDDTCRSFKGGLIPLPNAHGAAVGFHPASRNIRLKQMSEATTDPPPVDDVRRVREELDKECGGDMGRLAAPPSAAVETKKSETA
jgi:hypothetical protein